MDTYIFVGDHWQFPLTGTIDVVLPITILGPRRLKVTWPGEWTVESFFGP